MQKVGIVSLVRSYEGNWGCISYFLHSTKTVPCWVRVWESREEPRLAEVEDVVGIGEETSSDPKNI